MRTIADARARCADTRGFKRDGGLCAALVAAVLLFPTSNCAFAQDLSRSAQPAEVSGDASAADTAEQPAAPEEQSAAAPEPGKPKLDWGTEHLEFSAEAISIDQPRFVVDMPANQDSADISTNPDVLYAIVKPAFDAFDGLAVKRVEISDGTLVVRSDRKTIHELTELTASFALDQTTRTTLGKGTFTLRGETITFETAFKAPGDATVLNEVPLRLNVSGAGLSAKFDGVMKHGDETLLEGTVDVTVADLRKLVTWSGFKISEGAGLGRLRTRGAMAWASGLFSISRGIFTLDDNEARGVLSLDLRKQRSLVEGTLAIKRLDLTRYFPKKKKEEVKLIAALLPELETSTTISLPILRDFDADVRLSVNQIRAHGFETGEGAMTLSLRSGTLLADVAELHLFDGNAVGQLEFNTSSDDVMISARGLLEDVAVERALGWITDSKPVRGKTRLSVNLKGTGQTVGALVQSMKGDARLKMVDGGAFRIDVDGLLKKADGTTLIGWEKAGDHETEFSTLEARLQLGNGRISTERLRARRSATTVVGHGTINLKAQEVSIRLSVVNNGSGGQSEPTFPSGPTLTMRGPWDEPSISVENHAKVNRPARTGGEAVVLKTQD